MKSFQILLIICLIDISLSISGMAVIACAENLMIGVNNYVHESNPVFDDARLAYVCHNSTIPETLEQQYEGGKPGTGAEGDLVFFTTNGKGTVSHVGICIGNGRMIHVTNKGGNFQFADYVGSSYWTPKFLAFRRYAD